MDYPLTVAGVNLLSGKFTDGNPATGVPASNDSSEWANNVTDSIKNVQALAGLAPVENDPTQMATAITMLIRTRLTGPLTLYVNATTGSDANNGLTAGTPWLTIQHAINTIQSTYDLSGNTITIQLANGTYQGFIVTGTTPGQFGPFSLAVSGNSAAPTAVVVTSSTGNAVEAISGGEVLIENMMVQTTPGGSSAIAAFGQSQISLGAGVVFGPAQYAHMDADGSSSIEMGTAPYTIAGGAQFHIYAVSQARVRFQPPAPTVNPVTGTPAFTVAFAYAASLAEISYGGVSFSGAATGTRYSVSTNALINTSGGGASFFPGSSAGASATGGQYV